MTLLVANMFATASRHKQRAAQVNDALRYSGVDHGVRERVGEFFDHLATFHHPGKQQCLYVSGLPGLSAAPQWVGG